MMLPRTKAEGRSAHDRHVNEKNARNRNKHNLTPNFFEITQGREEDRHLQFDAHKQNDVLPDTNFQDRSNEKSILFSPDDSAHKLLGLDNSMIGGQANSHNRNSVHCKEEYTDTQGADSNAVVIDDFCAQIQLDQHDDLNSKSEAFPLKINDKLVSFGQTGASQLKSFMGLQKPKEQKENGPSQEMRNAPSPPQGKNRSEKVDGHKSKKLGQMGKAAASRSQIDPPSPGRLQEGKRNRGRPLKLGHLQGSNLSRSTVQSESQEGKMLQQSFGHRGDPQPPKDNGHGSSCDSAASSTRKDKKLAWVTKKNQQCSRKVLKKILDRYEEDQNRREMMKHTQLAIQKA